MLTVAGWLVTVLVRPIFYIENNREISLVLVEVSAF